MNVKLYSWESQRTKWWIFHQLSWVSDSRRVPGCDSETQKPPASTTQPATKNLVLLYSSNRKKKTKKSRICHCFSQKSYVSISFWGLYHHYTVIFQGAWPHPMLDELPFEGAE